MELGANRKTNLSFRAAIEGTISSLKRGQGLDDLKVRELIRCRAAIGHKTIGHNFQQFMRGLLLLANRAKEKLLEAVGKSHNQVVPPAPPGCSLTA